MMISKVYLKISVLFELFQNLEISELAMAKIQKVNITVTYLLPLKYITAPVFWANVIVTVCHFHPSLTFESKA
jgi:hypothetical protein